MTNILNDALAGRMKTIPITKKSVTNKEKPKQPNISSKYKSQANKRILLSFAGLATVTVASILLGKKELIKQNSSLATEMVQKSKTAFNEASTIKQTAISLHDDATKTIKKASEVIDTFIATGSLGPATKNNNYHLRFVDDKACNSIAFFKKDGDKYVISKVLKNLQDGSQNLISYNPDKTVSTIYKGIQERGEHIVSDTFTYKSGKPHATFIGARLNRKGSLTAPKGFIFNDKFVSFLETCTYTAKHNLISSKRESFFKDGALEQVLVNSKRKMNAQNITAEKVLVFKDDILKDVIQTPTETPQYLSDISEMIINCLFDS